MIKLNGQKIKNNELQDVFVDGEFVKIQTFNEIRKRVIQESNRVYGGLLWLIKIL